MVAGFTYLKYDVVFFFTLNSDNRFNEQANAARRKHFPPMKQKQKI